MFFFSSRRRHTRLQGDWSSDVCSSDLVTHMTHPRYFGLFNPAAGFPSQCADRIDRKSTRLNSSHLVISYAVFCLKKKKNTPHPPDCTHHTSIAFFLPLHITPNSCTTAG